MTDPFATPSGDPSKETVALPQGGVAPPAYGAPPPYGQPAAPLYGAPLVNPRRNGFGITALVLGILSIITLIGGLVLGVPAIIFGVLGRRRAKRGEASNGGVALSGTITGVIGVLLFGLYVTLAIVFLNSATGKRWYDCRQAAGNDRSAVQACDDRLARDFGGKSTAG